MWLEWQALPFVLNIVAKLFFSIRSFRRISRECDTSWRVVTRNNDPALGLRKIWPDILSTQTDSHHGTIGVDVSDNLATVIGENDSFGCEMRPAA